MSVHAKAPLRVDFTGGWTDVPEYAARETGAVVAAAVGLYAYVDAFLGGMKIKFAAEDLGERVTYQSSGFIRYDGRLDLHKAALNLLPVTGGIELLSRSDAPSGSGLGASGALDVALVAVLAHCRREPYDESALAELGFMLETQELGLLGGRQDQLTAALGGFQRYDFGDDRVEARRLSVTQEAADDLACHTTIVYTGQSHFSSATHAYVWDAYRNKDPQVLRALSTMRELSDRAAIELEAGQWQSLATTIDENWQAQRRLHPTIASERSEAIEAAMREAGAWGVKATGAGAGGCLLVLGPRASRAAVRDAARRAGGVVLETTFAMEGVNVWEHGDDGPH